MAIRELPAAVIAQISAGEVITRAGDVVKELVENAIDAGAHRVAIAIEFGGKKLIAVEDDGEGMTAEEAILALERRSHTGTPIDVNDFQLLVLRWRVRAPAKT